MFKSWGFEKVGCNHCTGILTAKKLIEAGVGVVKGTARNGTKDPAYLGNGDTILFAMNDVATMPGVAVPAAGSASTAAPASAPAGGAMKY